MELCHYCGLSVVCLSFGEQDNSQTRYWMSTKHGRHGPFSSHPTAATSHYIICSESVLCSCSYSLELSGVHTVQLIRFWHLSTGLKLNCLNLATCNSFWRHRSAPDSLTNWHVGRIRNLFVCMYWGGPWRGWLTIILQCYDTVGWVMWPIKSSPKWPIMCRGGRYTLLYHSNSNKGQGFTAP